MTPRRAIAIVDINIITDDPATWLPDCAGVSHQLVCHTENEKVGYPGVELVSFGIC